MKKYSSGDKIKFKKFTDGSIVVGNYRGINPDGTYNIVVKGRPWNVPKQDIVESVMNIKDKIDNYLNEADYMNIPNKIVKILKKIGIKSDDIWMVNDVGSMVNIEIMKDIFTAKHLKQLKKEKIFIDAVTSVMDKRRIELVFRRIIRRLQ